MSNEIFVSKGLIKKIDDITINSLEIVFGVIKENLVQDLKIITDTMFEKCETIFAYYSNLEESYRLILDKSHETINLITISSDKDIINSIYDTLIYEIIDIQKKKYLKDVFLQNKSFIKNQIELFCINFDVEKGYFLDVNNNNEFLKVSKNLHTNNFNLEFLLRSEFEKNAFFYYENIYKYYLEALNKIATKLSDFISCSIDFLKKERQVFDEIILINLPCLELQFKKLNYPISQVYEITELLKDLRISYFDLNQKIIILEEQYKKNMSGAFVKTFEEFCISSVDSVFFLINNKFLISTNHEIIDEIKKYIESFYIDKIKGRIKNLNIFEYIYKYQKQVSNIKRFSSDIADIFEELNFYFNENIDFFKTSDKWKLIKGINETVDIKIQSLNENCEIFSNQSLMLFDEISGYIKEPDIMNLNSFHLEVDEIIKQLVDTDEKFDVAMSKLDEKFNDCIKMSISKYKDKISSVLDKVSKQILSFLKDVLLFELCTFEEVYNYSISILKREEEQHILSYINKIDDALEKIFVILDKNDISIISPKEHDLFNAKEHEILVAEKNELFTKGEIIKVMNIGYKQNDLVIIRANVIAAK